MDRGNGKLELIDSFVKTFFGMDINDFVSSSDWVESQTICNHLIQNTLSENERRYIEEKIGHLDTFRDSRSSINYARELVLGWIVEDCLIGAINACGFKCESFGGDRIRELISNSENITGSSDLKVEVIEGKSVLIEVTTDYTAYWKRNGVMDLRNDKYNNIVKEDGCVLGIDFRQGEFCFFHILQTPATYLEEHPVWKKPAYEISIKGVPFRTIKNFKKFMKKMLLKGKKKFAPTMVETLVVRPQKSNTIDAWLTFKRR